MRFYINDIVSSPSKTQQFNDVYILGINVNQIDQSEYGLKVLKFDTKQNNIQVVEQISQQILWFSYRKNFPALLNTTLTTDAGWGCMIRAGQMAWAQILQKHIGGKMAQNKMLKKNTKERDQLQFDLTKDLLLSFADDDDNESTTMLYNDDEFTLPQSTVYPFSIQKIAFVGQKIFDLQPGDWYKPNYILHTLRYLHIAKQLNGSQDLKMVICNDSELFKDRILSEIQGVQYKCQHVQEIVQQEQIRQDLVCKQCQGVGKFGIALFIVTRLGLDKINEQYFPILDDLISLPQFQGIIGGRPRSALYMIGRLDQQYVYFDPHYVQEGLSQKNLIKLEHTFHRARVTSLQQQNLDPSMAICFYLRDEQELEQFWVLVINFINKKLQINEIKEKHKENFFIFLKDQTPDYMIVDKSSSVVLAQDDSDSEIIG